MRKTSLLSCLLAVILTASAQASSPDFNADGEVNVSDLLILLGHWGTCDGPCPCDLTGDGAVHAPDLLMLLSLWGPWEDKGGDDMSEHVSGGLYIERDDSQSIVIPGMDGSLFDSDFTIVARMRKSATGTFQHAVRLRNSSNGAVAHFFLGGASENDIRSRVITTGAGATTYTIGTTALGANGLLSDFLVALTWVASTRTLGIRVTNGTSSGQNTVNAANGDLPIPDNLDVFATMDGRVGCWAIVPGVALSLANLESMWATGHANAPLLFNDHFDVEGVWGGHFGIAMFPSAESGVTALNGRRLGSAVSEGDYLIYRKETGADNTGSWFTARAATVTGSLVYALDSNLGHAVPSVASGVTAKESNALRRWAANTLTSTLTIATNGNSRNVRGSSFATPAALEDMPHSFAAAQHNMMLLRRRQKCGANLNMRIRTSANDAKNPGYHNDAAAVTSGTVALADNASDFTRTFWNSESNTALGPGKPAVMAQNATMILYSDPIPGSNFIAADKALKLSYTLLKYPGSPNAAARAVESASKATGGSFVGSEIPVTGLDTTRITHTFTESNDTYTAGTRTLELDSMSGVPEVGELIWNEDNNALAEIESVDVNGATTTIVLRHAFDTAPSDINSLHIGPYDYEIAEVDSPTSADDHRGIWIEAGSGAGLGNLIVGAFNVATGESGNHFRFVQTGWGGQGATPQLDEAFADSFPKLLDAYNVDEAVVFDPYQSTTISTGFPALAEKMLEADSVVDVSFLIGLANTVGASQESTYRTWAFGQSTYPAVCVTDDELLGDQSSAIAYGAYQNASHWSTEGGWNVMIAAETLIQSEWEEVPATSPATLTWTTAESGGGTGEAWSTAANALTDDTSFTNSDIGPAFALADHTEPLRLSVLESAMTFDITLGTFTFANPVRALKANFSGTPDISMTRAVLLDLTDTENPVDVTTSFHAGDPLTTSARTDDIVATEADLTGGYSVADVQALLEANTLGVEFQWTNSEAGTAGSVRVEYTGQATLAFEAAGGGGSGGRSIAATAPGLGLGLGL